MDEETRIKNEEVISDKVLTDSNGFINRYEELQRKMQSGLHRIKIKATVERLGIVAKLKEHNIKIKDVPERFSVSGSSQCIGCERRVICKDFFGLSGERDAEQSSRESPPFEKPRVAGLCTRTYEVGLSVDLEKYNTFQKQASELLRRVAQQRGECLRFIANKPEGWGRKSGSGSVLSIWRRRPVGWIRQGMVEQGNSQARRR